LPDEAVQAQPGAGVASLHFKNVPVFDWISVLNSLSMGTKIAGTPLPAMMSMDIEWGGVIKRLGVFRNESLGFVDDFDEVDNVSVTVSTSQATGAPGATGQSFTFMSDPGSYVSKFSVVGRERNGVFARNSENRDQM
jgi:hypothetical protein